MGKPKSFCPPARGGNSAARVEAHVLAPTGLKSLDGMGAQAETAAGMVFLGNRLLMDTQTLAHGLVESQAARLQGERRTVVHVAQSGRMIGLIAIADVVLMYSDQYDLVAATERSRAALRKMHQNLEWALGYNVIAFPRAAGIFYPFTLSPEVAALPMTGPSTVVAIDALLLKRTKLAGLTSPASKGPLAGGERTARAPT